ncbi:MAG: hypothetical protein VYC39_02080 [Myxococcota bacterium]|nr:hypothetical protein [Myxococcota bacterium]
MTVENQKVTSERPYAFAVLALFTALLMCGGFVAWAISSPELVVIGAAGQHDGPLNGERLAGCLDCHVPFLGSPGSRCLTPSCHGNLATGIPPRTGSAMPVRFHVALNRLECSNCHNEHGKQPPKVAQDQFSHDIIPNETRAQCAQCHSGARHSDHSSTDSVPCSKCHGLESWDVASVNHQAIWEHACDVCHVTPEGKEHVTVAGTCSSCHSTSTWKTQTSTTN